MLKFKIIIILLVVFNTQLLSKSILPKAAKGNIDLSEWNFSSDGNIALDGEWEFYWKKLISTNKLSKISQPKYFNIPNLWNDYNESEHLKSGFGFASYRLKVILPEKDKLYAFKKGQFFTASKIWINDEIVLEMGKVSDKEADYEAKDFPTTFFYYAKTDTIVITIEICNFLHQKGGIKNSIIIGYPDNITRMQTKKTGSEFIILGILILIVISQLAMYFFHDKEITFLLFGLACFFSIIVLLSEGEFLLLKLFPNINQSLIYRIHYSINYLRLPLFAYFLALVFSDEISKRVSKVLLIIGFIFAVFTVIMPVNVFTNTILIFLLLSAFTLIYLLQGLVRAAIRKKEGSLLSLTGFFILFFVSINDILNDRLIIQTFSMVSYGVAAFIISQSAIMSFRFTKLFKKNEKLTIELKDINENLENLVKIRTSQIEQQKEEIQSQAEYLEKANSEILAQNDKLEIINNDITQSITYAKTIQTAILPSHEYLDSILPQHFILYKPRDIVSGDFYWAKEIENKKIIIAADCTGHGVPGAFMSMLGISFLNEIITANKYENPADTLGQLRKMVKDVLKQTGKENEQKDGMDIAMCVIDSDQLLLEFAGAYNPLYIIRNEEVIILKADRQPIAIHLIENDFNLHKFNLQKNDVIYLFSDGYLDQTGGELNKRLTSKNFKNLLLQIYKFPAKEQLSALENNLVKWIGNSSQLDDILIIGIKI